MTTLPRADHLPTAVQGETAQLTETEAAYSRFVPKRFLQLLGVDDIRTVQLGQQVERQLAVHEREGVVERAHLREGVLAGIGVKHQEHFVRRARQRLGDHQKASRREDRALAARRRHLPHQGGARQRSRSASPRATRSTSRSPSD